MSSDLERCFVALENMLEGGDLEAHFLGDPDQHDDLVLSIRMGVDQTFALENLDQGLQLQVAARRHRVGLGRIRQSRVSVPLAGVVAGAQEGATNRVGDAHPGRRVATRKSRDR